MTIQIFDKDNNEIFKMAIKGELKLGFVKQLTKLIERNTMAEETEVTPTEVPAEEVKE